MKLQLCKMMLFLMTAPFLLAGALTVPTTTSARDPLTMKFGGGNVVPRAILKSSFGFLKSKASRPSSYARRNHRHSTIRSAATTTSGGGQDESEQDKASKRASSAKASESIFLKLFGFSAPSPTSLLFLCAAMALGLNGNVPVTDLIFSLAFPMYLGILNRFRFDRNQAAKDAGKKPAPILREGRGEWYLNYITAFGLFSIVLPTIYCFAGPKHIAKSAVPYTYLALSQHISESLCRGPDIHVLIRLLVPLGFNMFRFVALFGWVKIAYTTYDTTINASLGVHVGHILGMILGTLNAVMWTYNLFGFLLPRVLPQYLDQNEFPTAEVEWKGQLIPVLK